MLPRVMRWPSATRPLRSLVEKPLHAWAVTKPSEISYTFMHQIRNNWLFSMERVYGQGFIGPPVASRIFYFTVPPAIVLIALGGCVTSSPFIYERLMPYHLKLAALTLTFQSGVGFGLEMARYGPGANQYGGRVATGVLGLVLTTATLLLADYYPWYAYSILTASYAGVIALDFYQARKQVIPTWMMGFRRVSNLLIATSVVLNFARGVWVQNNAEYLIMSASEY
mmetsp:Transcript_35476/g.92748  ORF Transcript_35476/g.92748 Transcript_35476/m.92748 type:complete len:225 (+) Transcript_35476:21-695(+)